MASCNIRCIPDCKLLNGSVMEMIMSSLGFKPLSRTIVTAQMTRYPRTNKLGKNCGQDLCAGEQLTLKLLVTKEKHFYHKMEIKENSHSSPMKIPGCWKTNLLEISECYHGLIPVISLLLRNRITVFYFCGWYLQGHSARTNPISIMPAKCMLVILHPANTHPLCEHNTGMELCPDKQIHTDFC